MVLSPSNHGKAGYLSPRVYLNFNQSGAFFYSINNTALFSITGGQDELIVSVFRD